MSLIAALTMSLVLASCSDSGGDDGGGGDAATTAKALSGYELTPPPRVAGLTLPDAASGDDFAMEAESGQLKLIYFGYLNCPDVCPTTLADVRKAFRLLPTESVDRLTVAMATVDPDRDEPEEVLQYVQSFVDGAHGLHTTDDDLLADVATAFGASYSVEVAADGTVEVGHSANLYVVDANGDIVLVWPFGIPAQQIADDLTILFDRGVA
jgi:protein SCO1/2